MSLLLRWHSQHRSAIGLEHTLHGRLRKVEPATPVFSLTYSLLVLSLDVSLGATGGEEENVVMFVGGDSAREDKGMSLCKGGDEVGDPLDVIQAEDPGSVTPATRLLLSGEDTVFLIPLDGVVDLVEADTRKIKRIPVSMMNIHYGLRHNYLYR